MEVIQVPAGINSYGCHRILSDQPLTNLRVEFHEGDISIALAGQYITWKDVPKSIQASRISFWKESSDHPILQFRTEQHQFWIALEEPTLEQVVKGINLLVKTPLNGNRVELAKFWTNLVFTGPAIFPMWRLTPYCEKEITGTFLPFKSNRNLFGWSNYADT